MMINELENFNEHLDDLPEYGERGTEHPSPEQLLLRMAVEKALMRDQVKIWEYYNYDRLTASEIAKKFNVDKSVMAKRIKTIERQLAKWVKEHWDVYEALKEAEETGC
jgi:predicted DNA-binding protein YlxM (UPF0122 family)